MIRMFCQHMQDSDSHSSEGHLIESDPTCCWFALILILPRFFFFFEQISASMQIPRSISETPFCWQEAQKSRDDHLHLSMVFTFHFCYDLDFNVPRFILSLGLFSVRPKLIFKYSIIYKHPRLPLCSSLSCSFLLPSPVLPSSVFLAFAMTIVAKNLIWNVPESISMQL